MPNEEKRGEKKKKKIFKTRQLVGGPRPGTQKGKKFKIQDCLCRKEFAAVCQVLLLSFSSSSCRLDHSVLS